MPLKAPQKKLNMAAKTALETVEANEGLVEALELALAAAKKRDAAAKKLANLLQELSHHRADTGVEVEDDLDDSSAKESSKKKQKKKPSDETPHDEPKVKPPKTDESFQAMWAYRRGSVVWVALQDENTEEPIGYFKCVIEELHGRDRNKEDAYEIEYDKDYLRDQPYAFTKQTIDKVRKWPKRFREKQLLKWEDARRKIFMTTAFQTQHAIE